MNIKLNKTNVFLSTFSFVLCIIGYPLITSIFLPITSDVENASRAITVPYRAFALLIMLLVIALNYKRTIRSFPFPLVILIVYWVLLILRMNIDIYLRSDIYVKNPSQLWLYVFGICLPVLFSTLKSYKYINLDKALLWVWISINVVLLTSLFANQALFAETGVMDRQNANIALNTIAYGHLGVMGVYLSFFYLLNRKNSFFFRALVVVVVFLSFYSMIRAGSRGPIIGLLVVLFFWIFSRRKNALIGSLAILITVLVLIIFWNNILSIVGTFSPIMEERIKYTLQEGDKGRSVLYQTGLNIFYENPFLGKHYALFNSDGIPGYTHNIFIDSLMAWGIVGGIMMIYMLYSGLKSCYYNINSKNSNFWISLILVHQMTANMFSGTFYEDPLLTMLLTYHFISYSLRKQSLIYRTSFI